MPAKFFGVVPQSNLSQENFTTLKQGGVKEMRVAMIWGGLQPTRGGAINWTEFDGQVERAAKSGIELLPFIVGTPSWAVPSVNVPGAPGAKAPARLPVAGTAGTAWTTFLKAAVARYGTNGTFWAENPTVPVRPIKAWQIWNEPNFKYFVAHPNPTEYGKLVKLVGDRGQIGRPDRPGHPRRALRQAGRRAVPEGQKGHARDQPELLRLVLPRTDVQDERGDQIQLPGRRAAPVRGPLPAAAGGDRRTPRRHDRRR